MVVHRNIHREEKALLSFPELSSEECTDVAPQKSIDATGKFLITALVMVSSG